MNKVYLLHVHLHNGYIFTPPFLPSSDLPNVTDTLGSNEERDSGYYVVRILPPVVGVSVVGVAVVISGLYIWYFRKYNIRKRRKGIYKCELYAIEMS